MYSPSPPPPEPPQKSSRRRPELSINVNTSSSPFATSSTPTNVPSSSRSKPPVSARLHRLPAPSPNTRDFEDSFLDDGARMSILDPNDTLANKENEPMHSRHPNRNTRDSHDLSFPDRQITRDSLVTNMLSSLDKFSLGQINTPMRPMFEDDDAYVSPTRADDYARSMSFNNTNTSTNPRTQPTTGRNRMNSAGPTPNHGYSYSSDLEGTDEAASRVSSQYSRGRRSNSSSGFQSSLARLSSLREKSRNGYPRRPLHSRGGKTSKSSSSNSIDAGYAQVLTTQQWVHGNGGRSSSFDYGTRPALNSPMSASPKGPWNSEYPNNNTNTNTNTATDTDTDTNTNTFLADDYEAAPTPTVPVGPRRLTATSSSAVASPQLPSSPALPMMDPDERKRSIQSRSGTRSRGGTSQKSSTQPSFGHSHDMPPVPPLDMADLDSAPAPHIGYGKTKEKEAARGGPPAASQPKEKPGFFKRMFGGASRNTTSSSTPAAPVAPEATEPTGSKLQAAKSGSAPPSRDSQNPPHVIQKKSSFFRRRKKSFNEPPLPAPPLPTPPVDLGPPAGRLTPKPEVSPVSSLREIMTPYLKDNNDAPFQSPSPTPTPAPAPAPAPAPPSDTISPSPGYNSEIEEAKRRMRGFSPEYEPSPHATIRTVKSQSALNTRSSTGSFIRWPGQSDTPTRQPPEVPGKKLPRAPDETFFNDSSDEDKPQDVRQRRSSRQHSGKSSPAAGGSRDNLRASVIREEQVTTPRRSPKLGDSSKSFLPSFNSDVDKLHSTLTVPSEGSQVSGRRSMSSESRLRSAASLPSVRVDNADARHKFTGSPLDEPNVTVGEPTEDDRQKARGIFDGNEDFIQKEKAAAWMGEEGLVRQRTLRAYMDLYDFTNHSVLSSLRQICTRLVLKAETQQVDRILVAFSKRWCESNPNHGFKTMDVIHTMCYSIMLLNTDLHLADIESKMTRSQFVKNTMTTIKQAALDSDPGAFDRSSILPGKTDLLTPTDADGRMSAGLEQDHRTNWRSSFRPQPRSESAQGNYSDGNADTCGPLVKSPFEGTMKAWEAQVEIVLKDIYVSIRDERLPLFGAEAVSSSMNQPGGLTVMNMLKRSPSVLSKAPSESQISTRGRMNEASRNNTGRWSSKSRSRPRLGGTGFSSSRTSFEDGGSIWSPAGSSATWSRYSLGRTQTSMSMDSFGSSYPHGDYQQSIGFANALSQAIIREDLPPATSGQSVISEELPSTQLLDDESLELAGPPWVKEGNVIHKHHLDGIDKKAKERNWTEVFAVVQKGTMSLFSFSTKSMRHKARHGRKQAVGPGAVVGGGNWQDMATSVGSFSLRQTLASALPPPGYSRTRSHVWALSLPTGAVHLFQVGTPEISKEFVLTVNYWSARLSTHPLIGGVSNIEYGWSDAIINSALIDTISESPQQPPRPGSAAAGRSSMHSRQNSRQSSLRSSFDVGGGSSSSRAKLPGDKVTITDWKPPTQSMRPSNCSEAEQLETLASYVRSIEEDLQQHNQLRSPMLLAFTPRGHNAARAMANWERKSSHLLREIVKFRTYVDSLQLASSRRAEIYAERDNAQRAARGEDPIDDDDDDEREGGGANAAEGDVTIKP